MFILYNYQVTWKNVLHMPASHPMQTPVRLNHGSEQSEHDLAPQRE